MESSEALDRMREKHARALDQLHVGGAARCWPQVDLRAESRYAYSQMMLAREMALKAAASDGQAAREEARQLRRRLETLEDTERESGRLVRDLQVQIKVLLPARAEGRLGLTRWSRRCPRSWRPRTSEESACTP